MSQLVFSLRHTVVSFSPVKMSVRNFLLFLFLFHARFITTICLELKSQAVNGLDLPADPVPIKIQYFNTYSPHIYNIDHKTFPVSCDSGENEWFTIQTTANGLVVDGSEPDQMRLQHFSRSPSQLWKFERAVTPGVYYIVNNNTGAALDVGVETTTDSKAEPKKIPVLKEKSGSSTQKWFTNWNGRIRNVNTKLNLDVAGAVFQPGTRLILWVDNGIVAQEFTLQQNVKQN